MKKKHSGSRVAIYQDSRQHYVHSKSLLLPSELAASIEKAEQEYREQKKAILEAVRPAAEHTLDPAIAHATSIASLQFEEDELLRVIKQKFPFPNLPPSARCSMQLYSAEAIHARYAKLSALTGDSDDRQKTIARLDSLRTRGTERELATVNAAWRSKLDDLESAQPNFAAVIEYLPECAKPSSFRAVMDSADGIAVFSLAQ